MLVKNITGLSKQDLIKKVSELAGINCSLNWDISRFKEVNERLEKEILDKDKRIEELESLGCDENTFLNCGKCQKPPEIYQEKDGRVMIHCEKCSGDQRVLYHDLEEALTQWNNLHKLKQVSIEGTTKTLRDEFAAMIFDGYLKLLLANPIIIERLDMKGICKSVYPLADFMMEGR